MTLLEKNKLIVDALIGWEVEPQGVITCIDDEHFKNNFANDLSYWHLEDLRFN